MALSDRYDAVLPYLEIFAILINIFPTFAANFTAKLSDKQN